MGTDEQAVPDGARSNGHGAGTASGLAELSRPAAEKRLAARLASSEFEPFAEPVGDIDVPELISTIEARQHQLLAEVARRRELQRILARQRRRLEVGGWATSAVLLAGIVVAFVAIALDAAFDDRTIGRLDSTTEEVSWLFLLALAGVLVMAAWMYIRRDSPVRRQLSETERQLRNSEERLDRRLDYEVDRHLRLRINDMGEDSGTLLLAPEAPDLVEVESAEPVETPAIAQLRDVIRHASTSAVAVAGSRGSGKSTLIRTLVNDTSMFDVSVLVPAPVKYDADALLRRIYSETAHAILRSRDREDLAAEAGRRDSTTARRRRRSAALASMLIAVVLFFVDLLGVGAFDVGIAGTAGAFLALGALYGTLGDRIERPLVLASDRDAKVLGNALEALERLRWEKETGAERTTGMSAAKLVSVEDTERTSWRERAWTRPELIADLTQFLRRHLLYARATDDGEERTPRIAIAIDELDKLPTGADILETVNSLKDLFRIPGVHCIVSVSSNAITGFSLRGIAERDAFDSSFDEVVELGPIRCQRVFDLINARTVGFPQALAAVCHSWSGGVPRDMIRAARRCVQLRRQEGITDLEFLAVELIRDGVACVFRTLSEYEADTRDGTDLTSGGYFAALVLIDRPLTLRTCTAASDRLRRCSEILTAVADRPLMCQGQKVIEAALVNLTFVSRILTDGLTADPASLSDLSDEVAALTAMQNRPIGDLLAASTRLQADRLTPAVGARV